MTFFWSAMLLAVCAMMAPYPVSRFLIASALLCLGVFIFKGRRSDDPDHRDSDGLDDSGG
jgi:hypothetical protein